MTLYEILKLIDREWFPLNADKCGIDDRPNSSNTVTLCFMCEEETWITVNIESAILIPWYDCEVASIEGGDKESNIRIWIKSTEYIKKNYPQHVKWKDTYK